MNKEQILGKAQNIKGKIKEAYSKLTDDDMSLLDSKRDQFMGKIQEYYGIAKEDAEKKIKKLEEECCETSDTK